MGIIITFTGILPNGFRERKFRRGGRISRFLLFRFRSFQPFPLGFSTATAKAMMDASKRKLKIPATKVHLPFAFSGKQTMQDAFEQLIERQAYGQLEEWFGRKVG